MLYIKLTPRLPLLYGDSVFWFFSFWFAPFYWLPDLERAGHRCVAHQLPRSKTLISYYNWASQTPLIRLYWRKLIILTQVLFLIMFVVIGIALQKRILEIYGLRQADNLSYKTLHYTPTIARVGLVVVSITALAHMSYDIWNAYERADYFAVDFHHQGRLALRCLCTIIPDCLFNVGETYITLSVIQANLRPALAAPAGAWSQLANFLVYTLFLSVSMVNVLIRYKPTFDLMYLSGCVRHHLERVNGQVQPIEMTIEANKLVCAYDEHAGLFSETSLRRQRQQGAAEPSVPIELHQHAAANLAKLAHLTRAQIGRQTRLGYLLDEAASQTTTSLTSLQQLERHLTQLQLLVSSVDRRSPASVLALVLTNCLNLYYIILYTIQLHTPSNLLHLLTLANLMARLLPLCTLFLHGHLLEAECRRLVSKFEVAYLQEQSQSLMYKQMLDAHWSLGRVLKLTESIKFDCNGLMAINLGTLAKCVVYIFGGVFVVLQYDVLIGS